MFFSLAAIHQGSKSVAGTEFVLYDVCNPRKKAVYQLHARHLGVLIVRVDQKCFEPVRRVILKGVFDGGGDVPDPYVIMQMRLGPGMVHGGEGLKLLGADNVCRA